jgi:hypothetical protein
MDVKVSIGEAVDKYNILELKMKKIFDENKKKEIQKELGVLHICSYYKETYEFYYNMLTYVNEKIWNMTDEIKQMTPEHSQYSSIANNIFEYNQRRFRIKNWFNNSIMNSNIKEQKSYPLKHCSIVINDENVIYDKIAEINYLSLDYDIITFNSPYISNLKNIFTLSTFIYDENEFEKLDSPTIIYLNEFQVEIFENPEIKNIFEFSPITYVAGGLLSDFIQSLSVINEKFYQTGRKGFLYISEKGDSFTKGLENTYNDTYEIVSKQRYIKDYKIYNNEICECDLTLWREDSSLYQLNWYELYKKVYNVEWGTHPWLHIETNHKWDDVILINTRCYRWPLNIDFNLLHNVFSDKIIFISADINECYYFVSNTGLKIRFYKCTSFTELCVAINSCKLFVGSLSMPLTIAHAVYKKRITSLCNITKDNNLNSGLDCIWKNIRYSA